MATIIEVDTCFSAELANVCGFVSMQGSAAEQTVYWNRLTHALQHCHCMLPVDCCLVTPHLTPRAFEGIKICPTFVCKELEYTVALTQLIIVVANNVTILQYSNCTLFSFDQQPETA